MNNLVRDYVRAAAAAVRVEDGPRLAALLSLDKAGSPYGSLPLALAALDLPATVASCFGGSDPKSRKWQAVVAAHLLAVAELSRGDAEAAFDAEHAALDDFVQLVTECATNWQIQPLHVLVRDARRLSVRLEAELAARGAREAANGKINLLATTLRNAFAATANHRLPRDQLAASKKWGALAVVCVLFRMYFKLNQLRQAKFLIGAVEGPGFPPLEEFPVAQVVTYRYYAGRLAMFDDAYPRANTLLTYALTHVHAGYLRNVRAILDALVPVRLALGVLPAPALLSRHGLDHYAGVAAAMRSGDVGAFRAALEAHRPAFIASGAYLLLERLSLAVTRTLFKRAARALGAGTTRLPLPALAAALAFSTGEPPDLPAVECAAVNLVAGRFVRGYVSHKGAMLVVAKDRAWPPLAQVAASE